MQYFQQARQAAASALPLPRMLFPLITAWLIPLLPFDRNSISFLNELWPSYLKWSITSTPKPPYPALSFLSFVHKHFSLLDISYNLLIMSIIFCHLYPRVPGRQGSFFCSLIYPQCLEQCLAYGRILITTCLCKYFPFKFLSDILTLLGNLIFIIIGIK